MYLFLKRFFDILFSLFGILVISPLLIPIMIGLKFTGEGEIFYFQKRIGQFNKYFDIYKFATMVKNSPNLGTGSITLRNDPRITPMGGFLRRTKINELPQLFNVFLGTMSFVGPRPQMKVDFEAFPAEVQEKIFDVKPGITSLGSIIFRDEEKWISEAKIDPIQYYQTHIQPFKGYIELWYQKNISFWVDLKILFLTFWYIVSPDSNLIYSAFPDLPRFNPEI